MALFGWIVVAALSLLATVAYGFVAVMGLGRYNIGGAPNSLAKKAVIVAVGGALVLWWRMVAGWAPFAVVAA